MKCIYWTILVSTCLLASTPKPKYEPNVVPKNMSVQTKKSRFYSLLVPAVEKVHSDLMKEYKSVERDIREHKNTKKIMQLKADYNVITNNNLLACLKPHPQSIVLAQAAIESSWATSRFFIEANNVFGMHSINSKEPRIAASKKRGGIRTVWLRKFDSVEASVKAYYRLMSRSKAFREFRLLRLQTNNPYKLVKKLDNYSEIGDAYGVALSKLIRYNKLERFDK